MAVRILYTGWVNRIQKKTEVDLSCFNVEDDLADEQQYEIDGCSIQEVAEARSNFVTNHVMPCSMRHFVSNGSCLS